jgi:hypothetical protein
MAEVYSIIDEITAEKVSGVDGPDRLVRLGEEILDFAQTDEAKNHGVDFLRDLHTQEPLVVWNRNSITGKQHHITMTRWSSGSFVLYDNVQQRIETGGVIIAYLFGNDTAVRGLVKAMPPRAYRNEDEELSRYDLEKLINGYQRHPTRNAMPTPVCDVATFCKLVKRIVDE